MNSPETSNPALPTLYTLTADLLELEARLRDAEEEGEPIDALLAEYLTTGEDFVAKAERYGHLIRQREAEAAVAEAAHAAMTEELDRLYRRATTSKRTADRLKAALQGAMTVLDQRALRTATFTFKRQGNGGVKPLEIDPVNLHLVPEEFTRPSLATDLIREALEAGELVAYIDPATGEAIPFARLKDRGEHLRIL